MKAILRILLISLCSLPSFANTKLKFSLLFGDEDKCLGLINSLQERIEVSAHSFPMVHQAGGPLKVQLTISKSSHLDEAQWRREFSNANLASVIEQPYIKHIHHNLDPDLKDFFFSEGAPQTFSLVTDIAPSIGGSAKHRLSIMLQAAGTDYYYCMVAAELDSITEFKSDHVDITPPLVRSIRYDKNAYRIGDEVKVLFKFTEALSKAESDHIDFTNPLIEFGDDSRSIPKYGSPEIHKLVQLAEAEYLVTFKIPEGTKAGSYFPEFFNRSDKFGNFEDQLGAYDDEEQQVVKSSPLVVVED